MIDATDLAHTIALIKFVSRGVRDSEEGQNFSGREEGGGVKHCTKNFLKSMTRYNEGLASWYFARLSEYLMHEGAGKDR